MKLKYYIDTNKGITFIVILLLMAFYHRWQNGTAWVYLALHGTYGILWVLKSRLFPDRNWEKKVSPWFGLVSWLALVLYWIPGWMVVAWDVQAPAWLLAVCISAYTFGAFFVFSADMQKFVSLQLNPGTLVTEGMMSLSRNINYFGELLIYLSFALLALNPWAFLPLMAFIVTFWIPNMVRKDRSLALLPGFADYKKKTKSFFPFLF